MPPSPAGRPTSSEPKSEGDLVHQRPPVHRDGAFPRSLLLPGERVLLEGRPVFWRQRRGSFGVALALLLVALVVLLGYTVAPPGSTGALIDLVVFEALFAALGAGVIAVAVRGWRRSAFALTQRRVLWVEVRLGTRFRFAEWGRVVRLLPPASRISDLRFEVLPPSGRGRGNAELFVWPDVAGAPRVYHFVQSAFRLQQVQLVARREEEAQRARLLSGRSVCAYCGSVVAAPPSGTPDPRCPVCSAPIDLDRRPPETPSLPSPVPEFVAHARPAVHLGRAALPWFEAGSAALVGLFAAAGLVVEGATLPGAATSWLYGALLASFFGLLAAFYVASFLAAQRWAVAARTLYGSLPSGSPERASVAGPLRRQSLVALAMVPLSLGFLLAAVALFGGSVASSSALAAPPDSVRWAVEASLAASFAAAGLGTLELLRGFALLVHGSEIPEIERESLAGLRWGTLGLAVGTVPGAGFLIGLVAGAPPWVLALSLWAGVVSATLVLFGSRRVARAHRSWSELAERYSAGSAGEMPGGLGSEGLVDPRAYGGRSRPPGARRAVLVTVAVAAIATLAGASWVLDHGSFGPASGSAPPPVPAPRTVVPAGAVWSIPVGHYEYLEFPLNRSATLDGRFNATTVVAAYVMDSNQYAIWTIGGRLSAAYASGNVTGGTIHLTLPGGWRWYLVVVDQSASHPADVAWPNGCEASF